MECKKCVMEQFFVALQAPVSAPKDRKPDACGTEKKTAEQSPSARRSLFLNLCIIKGFYKSFNGLIFQFRLRYTLPAGSENEILLP